MIRLMSSTVSLFILSSVLTIAAAVIIPPSNKIHQTRILPNNMTAPIIGAIDPRFTTQYYPGEERLSATSSLMNAVHAMMELALENFAAPILARNYQDADYPEVMIVPIRSEAGYRAEASFLLWGIWEGIMWMINHQSFRDLVIDAYWDGVLLCGIWIKRGGGILNIAGSNSTLGLTARLEKISIHNATDTRGVSMVDVGNPLNDRHLTVAVTAVGEALRITELFITIFAVLEYLAHFPSTDEVVSFQISPDDEDTTIGIVEHALPARPPFLEYQWVILSMGQIPEYMLQQRRFSEVVIEIFVDGVLLGEGFISK